MVEFNKSNKPVFLEASISNPASVVPPGLVTFCLKFFGSIFEVSSNLADPINVSKAKT